MIPEIVTRNSHAVYTKYIGPTNYKGAYVKIWTYDVDSEHPVKKRLNYDYTFNTADEIAVNALVNAGLNIVGINTHNPDYTLVMLSWDYDKLSSFFGRGG